MNKFNGLRTSLLERQLFDILYKLEVLKEPDVILDMAALQAALSASFNNFGKASTLIIDPSAFDCLKNITFDGKKVKKKKLK